MISLSQVMVSLYSHSFLFDPVLSLLLALGFFSQLFARLSSGIGVSILFLRLRPITANMSMYSESPPYDHIGNTVTSLLRPLFLAARKTTIQFVTKKNR